MKQNLFTIICTVCVCLDLSRKGTRQRKWQWQELMEGCRFFLFAVHLSCKFYYKYFLTLKILHRVKETKTSFHRQMAEPVYQVSASGSGKVKHLPQSSFFFHYSIYNFVEFLMPFAKLWIINKRSYEVKFLTFFGFFELVDNGLVKTYCSGRRLVEEGKRRAIYRL